MKHLKDDSNKFFRRKPLTQDQRTVSICLGFLHRNIFFIQVAFKDLLKETISIILRPPFGWSLVIVFRLINFVSFCIPEEGEKKFVCFFNSLYI